MAGKEKEGAKVTWKHLAAIAAALLVIYTLLDKGLFDSFVVTPAKFETRMSEMEDVSSALFTSLNEDINEQKILIIKLQTQMELIQAQLVRMESKIDKGMMVGATTGFTKEASPK